MKRLLLVVVAVAAFSMSTVGARAEFLTMNLISPSHMSVSASLMGGLISLDPQGLGADDTTYSGSITVDVDSLLAPTSITLVSANVVAADSGQWLPKISPSILDYKPADWANYGLQRTASNVPMILIAIRNTAYDIFSDVEAVDAAGNFGSGSEALTFLAGSSADYWFDPKAGAFGGGTLDLTGSSTNETTALSSYVVSGLLAKLTIPIELTYTEPDSGLTLVRSGVFVATAAVPEPATWVLMGLGIVALVGVARRKYRR